MRKGLIYREMYLNRKRYIVGIVVYIAMLFIGVLIRMSMSFGNLANVDEEVFKGMDLVTYYMFTLATPLIMILSFSETPEIIVSDNASGWSKFSYTFPITSKEMALHKTCMTMGGYLISVVISIINFAICCPLCDRKFDVFNFKIMVVLMFVSCISTATEQILTYKFKNITLTQVITSLIFVVIYVVGGLSIAVHLSSVLKKYDVDIQNGDMSAVDALIDSYADKLKDILDVFVILVPFLVIGVFALEYLLTKKILDRREK